MKIRPKIILSMGLSSAIVLIGVAVTSYVFTVEKAKEEAKEKGRIVLNYVDATRKYMKDVQKPIISKIVGKEKFLPDLMSGFVASRETYERFSKWLPGYKFKQATIDPLNSKNKADADEIRFIDEFRKKPELTMKEGMIVKNGVDCFYLARPIKILNKKCLNCHGNPKTAPKEQIEIYGDKNGYHWEEGDTVASYVVYVPMTKALKTARKNSFLLAGIGGSIVLLAIIVLWFFLNKSVVAPLLYLSNRTEDISVGRDLEKGMGMEKEKNDEIGTLAKSIDRLRLSILKIIKRKG